MSDFGNIKNRELHYIAEYISDISGEVEVKGILYNP